jgi:hypothetical protein
MTLLVSFVVSLAFCCQKSATLKQWLFLDLHIWKVLGSNTWMKATTSTWVLLWLLQCWTTGSLYEGQFVRECIQKFPDWVDKEIITINTGWEATQRVMAVKLTRLIHKIAIQLHLVAESCTTRSSRCRRPVRKLLDTPSYCCVTWMTLHLLLIKVALE